MYFIAYYILIVCLCISGCPYRVFHKKCTARKAKCTLYLKKICLYVFMGHGLILVLQTSRSAGALEKRSRPGYINQVKVSYCTKMREWKRGETPCGGSLGVCLLTRHTYKTHTFPECVCKWIVKRPLHHLCWNHFFQASIDFKTRLFFCCVEEHECK